MWGSDDFKICDLVHFVDKIETQHLLLVAHSGCAYRVEVAKFTNLCGAAMDPLALMSLAKECLCCRLGLLSPGLVCAKANEHTLLRCHIDEQVRLQPVQGAGSIKQPRCRLVFTHAKSATASRVFTF